jgi:fatty acid elongase 3
MIYEALSHIPITLPKHYTSWQPGLTPLSTPGTVWPAMFGYLAILYFGQKVMEDRKAMQLKPLFMLHNFLLSTGSGLLLALMLEEIVPIVYKHGFFFGICHIAAWTPRMEFFYMINYVFKYWEFVDTFFLVVKKKPLAFLHVFHHSATMILCWTQLNGKTSVSWVVITANLLVHVLMYYYYFMASAGYKIWWKKYLTTLQISQFVIDLFIVYFASYSYFTAEYFPRMPTMGSCSGSEAAAVIGCVLLTSYLFLFIAFYRKTYKKAAASKAAAKKVE